MWAVLKTGTNKWFIILFVTIFRKWKYTHDVCASRFHKNKIRYFETIIHWLSNIHFYSRMKKRRRRRILRKRKIYMTKKWKKVHLILVQNTHTRAKFCTNVKRKTPTYAEMKKVKIYCNSLELNQNNMHRAVYLCVLGCWYYFLFCFPYSLSLSLSLAPFPSIYFAFFLFGPTCSHFGCLSFPCVYMYNMDGWQ